MVELRGWLVIFACPGLASVETYRHSAVVENNHATRILGVNPHAMVVAMRNFDFVERVAAIGRSVEIYVGDVDRIGVLRIGDDVHVIPGTRSGFLGSTISLPMARESRRPMFFQVLPPSTVL